ncbi:genetic suppressor element 1-like [Latimeria chalumnae]|uniref:genetic suppressor element 1-like n=1 Tax=Latimeria chalumnae TaxID=7897 RepID=UPI00313EA16E
MDSNYTAMYLQMKLKGPRRNMHRHVGGMSHEPKSPSLGMITPAPRSMAAVNPLAAPSLTGTIGTNGSHSVHGTAASVGGHTASFAAALRKLAKKAEEPRGSSYSRETPPTSSPAASRSSPGSIPKRPSGKMTAPSGSQRAVNAPVVAIAPTQTSSALWRSDSCQLAESAPRISHDHRLSTDSLLKQEKNPGPTPHGLYLSSGAVQDVPYPPINLQRPAPHMIPTSNLPDDYLRGFHPYVNGDELRPLSSLHTFPLDATTSAVPAAYFHPAFFPHLPFQHRFDDPYLLSLRMPLFPLPESGSLSPHHHPAVGYSRYAMDVTNPNLRTLHSVLTERRKAKDEEHSWKEKEYKIGNKFAQEHRAHREAEQEVREHERKRGREPEWKLESHGRKEVKQEGNQDMEYSPKLQKYSFTQREAESRKLVALHPYCSLSTSSPQAQRGEAHSTSQHLFSSHLMVEKARRQNRQLLQEVATQQVQRQDHPSHALPKQYSGEEHQFLGKKKDSTRISKDREKFTFYRGPPPLTSLNPTLSEPSSLPEPLSSDFALDYSIRRSQGSKRDSDRTTGEHEKNTDGTKPGVNPPSFKQPICHAEESPMRQHFVPNLIAQAPHQATQPYTDLKREHASSCLRESAEECLDLSVTSGAGNLGLRNKEHSCTQIISPLSNSELANITSNNEGPQHQKSVVSKLDLLEKQFKEAKKKGKEQFYSMQIALSHMGNEDFPHSHYNDSDRVYRGSYQLGLKTLLF